MRSTRRNFLVAIAALGFGTKSGYAQQKRSNLTAVYVKDMHCGTCAKKIASKLYAVPGVVKVTTNVKKGLAVITPQKQRHPSPKRLWEAIELAKFEPIKIASPLGTFTKKPRR